MEGKHALFVILLSEGEVVMKKNNRNDRYKAHRKAIAFLLCIATALFMVPSMAFADVDPNHGNGVAPGAKGADISSTGEGTITEAEGGTSYQQIVEDGGTKVFGTDDVNSLEQLDPQYKAGSNTEFIDEENVDDFSQLIMSKTIEATPTENEFEITLEVKTRLNLSEITYAPNALVILVIDVSGSMGPGRNELYEDPATGLRTWTRMKVAEEAAKSFISSYSNIAGYEDSGVIRGLAVVKFGTNVECIQDWTNVAGYNAAQLNTMNNQSGLNNLDNDSVGAGTNVAGALKYANNLLDASVVPPEWQNIQNVHVILLSDGGPTCATTDASADYNKNTGVMNSNFGTTIVRGEGTWNTERTAIITPSENITDSGITGSGSAAWNNSTTARNNHYWNNARYALIEANSLKANTYAPTVHTIGFTTQNYSPNEREYWAYYRVNNGINNPPTTNPGAMGNNMSVENFLKSLSSLDKNNNPLFYDASDDINLDLALRTIYGEISSEAWGVIDPMGDFINLTLPLGTIDDSKNKAEVKVDPDTGKKYIDWDLFGSSPIYETDTNGGLWYCYKLSYPIQLEIDAPGFDFTKEYSTNDDTILDYFLMKNERIEGKLVPVATSEHYTEKFIVPSVKPFARTLKFVKISDDEEPVEIEDAGFTLHRISAGRAWESDEVFSGSDGTFEFDPIGEGSYMLEESQRPIGYNSAGPWYFDISYGHATESADSPQLLDFDINADGRFVIVNERFSGDAELIIKKIVEAAPDSTLPADLDDIKGTFYFDIVQVKPDGDGGWIEVASGISKSGIEVDWPTPGFTKVDLGKLGEGTYYFKITEDLSNVPDWWKYDDTFIIATVEVKYNEPGPVIEPAAGQLESTTGAQGLVDDPEVIDKDGLFAIIEYAEELAGDLDENDYDGEIWDAFVTALAEAKAVYEDEEATQEEIDDALNSLLDAIEALDLEDGTVDLMAARAPTRGGHGGGHGGPGGNNGGGHGHGHGNSGTENDPVFTMTITYERFTAAGEEKGDISESKARFTNLYTTPPFGSLTVGKQATGYGRDTTLVYDINVKFILPQGKSSGLEKITYQTADMAAEGNYLDDATADGLTLKLKEGETVFFDNIPVGVLYEVTEDTSGLPPNYELTGITYPGSGAGAPIVTGDNGVVTVNNFYNVIDVEVNMDTILRTSAAYSSLYQGAAEEGVENVGDEQYIYEVNFRSTSSMALDSFIVEIPLEGVAQGYIGLDGIWTPEVYGALGFFNESSDYEDGYDRVFRINYLTNIKSGAWVLWKEISTAAQPEYLPVSGLGLAANEYVTALQFDFGKVEEGFTSLNGEIDQVNGTYRGADGKLSKKMLEDETDKSNIGSGAGQITLLDSGSVSLLKAVQGFMQSALRSVSGLFIDIAFAADAQGAKVDWTDSNITGFTGQPATLIVSAKVPLSNVRTNDIVGTATVTGRAGNSTASDRDAVVTHNLGNQASTVNEPGMGYTFDNVARYNEVTATGTSVLARTYDAINLQLLIICMAGSLAGLLLLLAHMRSKKRKAFIESGAGQPAKKRFRKSGFLSLLIIGLIVGCAFQPAPVNAAAAPTMDGQYTFEVDGGFTEAQLLAWLDELQGLGVISAEVKAEILASLQFTGNRVPVVVERIVPVTLTVLTNDVDKLNLTDFDAAAASLYIDPSIDTLENDWNAGKVRLTKFKTIYTDPKLLTWERVHELGGVEFQNISAGPRPSLADEYSATVLYRGKEIVNGWDSFSSVVGDLLVVDVMRYYTSYIQGGIAPAVAAGAVTIPPADTPLAPPPQGETVIPPADVPQAPGETATIGDGETPLDSGTGTGGGADAGAVGNLPWWAWLIVGIVVVAAVALIVTVVKKRKQAVVEE